MHIIGSQSKSLDDFMPLNGEEVSLFIKGMEQYIKSDVPMEIPVGISGNDLGRLSSTLKKMSAFIEKVCHAEAGIENAGQQQLTDRWVEIQNEAKELIASRPRLILPR